MSVDPLALFEDEEPPKPAQDHLTKVCACRRRVFSTEEDRFLSDLVTSKVCSNWFEISQRMPGRTARQCRDRWMNYLSPTNSFEPWTCEEDDLIVQKVNEIGTRWAQIAKLIKGRSDNSVKNRWYSGLKSQCVMNQEGKYILVRPTLTNIKPHPKRERQVVQYTVASMPMMMGMAFPVVRQCEPIFVNQPVLMPQAVPHEQPNIDRIFDKTIFSQVKEISQDPFTEAVDLFADWYQTYDT